MLDSALSAISPQLETPKVLEFQSVALSYETDGHRVRIIEDATFAMDHAEFVSIVGPSGCGKTSLLRMVSGLNPAQEGQVLFRSTPITGPLKSVGIAFQNPVLLPWRNTLDNVLLPLEIVEPYKQNFQTKREEYAHQAQKLLATVGLEGFQKRYPWQLSGGMKQRASLCRALIHAPEVLLLDEPFAALDAFTREDMWEMLQKLWIQTECTTLLITHDLREAVFLSDTIYVLSPRPSSIIFKLAVTLPRPRSLEVCLSDDFHHLVTEVRRHIHRSY